MTPGPEETTPRTAHDPAGDATRDPARDAAGETAGETAGDAAGGRAGEPTGEAALTEIIGPPVVMPAAGLPEPRGMSRLRLVQIYRWGSIILGLLLLVSFAQAGSALYGNNQARNTLIDRIDPATLEQFRLSSAIAAQDMAIRDYASTGRPAHVLDYRAAVAQERAAAAKMRRLLSGVARGATVTDMLDRVSADAAAWRTGFADPLAATPGGRAIERARDEEARRLFSTIRNDIAPLQRSITTLHGEAAAKLRSRASTALWSAVVALGLVVLAALALTLVFRRTVLTPMSLLGGQVRAVALGDFAHPLDVRGPAEIDELAVIIDGMRRRILDEWRATTEATRRLDAQAGELRRSNAELEQFAYVASHDLQEPLRKVASFCQMIERRYGDQLDERGRQYIAFAVDGAKRMQALINDLLGFSRVGRITRTEDSVDLNAIARQVLDDLGTLAEETGAEVEVGDLPSVPGDPAQLARLFQNLIGNAVKFRRPDEPPRVTIDARRSGAEWEFRCADNGIGIEPRYADRIFLIFQRLHPREEYTGTGIGLALCKKIVEFHGGRIWLDTRDRGGSPGTTFRWTLPAGDHDDQRPAPH